MENKKCACCGEIKDVSCFNKDKQKKDGFCSYCKLCCKIKFKSYNIDKEKIKKTQKKYYLSLRDNEEKLINYRKKYAAYKIKYNDTAKGKFWNLIGRAKRAKINFSISLYEFENWFNNKYRKCYYCDKEIEFGDDKNNGNSQNHLTIDRLNNKDGYNINNIVFCCRRCNTIKGAWFSEKEMIEIANKYLKNKDYE